MDPKKLTSQELSILTNKELMPAKQSLLSKLEKYLGSLSEILAPIVRKAAFLPDEVFRSSPKISRGENYHAQPYRVLDYPRAFSGKDIFTFRTLILWGHEIGFHFILGGKYKESYQAQVLEHINELPKGFYVSCQDTPWIWESEASGLVNASVGNASLIQKHVSEKLFIKLSYFIRLENYESIPEEGVFAWKAFSKCLNT